MRKFGLFSVIFFTIRFYAQVNLCTYVNPFIGTSGGGHTFPGAVLPFGMVQLSPDTRADASWEGCSGYDYGDNVIYGFSHTHLSGTGISDFGDILLMPMLGTPSTDNKIYASKFSHSNEKAGPGFYEVMLDDDKIKAELTVTQRVGIHRYTFPASEQAHVILDLLHRDKTLNCGLRLVDSVTITGYRVSEAWAKKQHVYFVMKFSKPFTNMEYAVKGAFQPYLTKMGGGPQGASFRFNTSDGKPLLIKVAISNTGVEGAIKNMEAEGTHWDFEQYKKEAEDTWNKQLRKIEVIDADKKKLTIFYSALYHCCIHPSLNMDVDGRYRGRDGQLHTAKGFTNYSVFSLWDTYRALHPLLTIIEPKRTSDFINTFLVQYQHSGRLPVWELAGNETDCMIGFHSVSVISDAILKEIGGFDKELAFEAMRAASNYTGFGIPVFNKKGFLEINDESESVSKSLEYAYDNWCISQVARYLKKYNEAELHYKRSLSFYNFFNEETGFLRPRKNGNWLNPFYPSEINNHFTEANSWQYSFYVPHNIESLIKLHGGSEKFEKKLDELFTTSQKLTGREQLDVTGLIGQYAHGNEPSHHMAYLYNYVGKPQKTIERIHQILNEFYKNDPQGLIGNEDCGQMSAWYVFGALGFYPVCPGSTQFALSEPLFADVKLHLDNGLTTQIESEAGKGNKIKEIVIAGKPSLMSEISYSSLVKGSKIKFIYENKPEAQSKYGLSVQYSPADKKSFIPAPLIKTASQVFKEKLEVAMSGLNNENLSLFYTLDGKEPTKRSTPYKGTFLIDKNSTIKVRAYKGNDSSVTTTAMFYKLKYDFDIVINSKANIQYAAEGPQTMIDDIHADENWRRGDWLGYQGQDFECIVDMKKDREIDFIGLSFLQVSPSWIIFPVTVDFYSSTDNKNYTLLQRVECSVKPEDKKEQVARFEKKFPQKITTRYIKIVAKNFGKLPDSHPGKGGDAFIFVDELEIK